MTGDEVEAAASGSNANSIRFAIDSALLAVLPRSVQWASVVSELETLPILERHQALVSDGGAEKDREAMTRLRIMVFCARWCQGVGRDQPA